MKNFLVFVVWVVWAVWVSAPTLLIFSGIPVEAAETVDRIVAVVGGEIITASDLKKVPKQGNKDPLTTLIHDKLLTQEMGKLEITVSDGEIAEAVQNVLARNKMPLEALKQELSQKGVSFDQYKKDLAQQIRRMKFLGRVIVPRIRLTEEEINRKAGPGADEETKMRARQSLLEARIPDEMDRYLEELREKSYVEIKEK